MMAGETRQILFHNTSFLTVISASLEDSALQVVGFQRNTKIAKNGAFPSFGQKEGLFMIL